MNREQWLTEFIKEIRPLVSASGYALPENIRVSCGWPSSRALSATRRRIAECWYPQAAKDGVTQIFVSPVLDTSLEVAEAVVHELGHAALGSGAGHKAPFRAYMRAIGLTGKPTATRADTSLQKHLEEILRSFEPYPNASLDKLQRPTKKQASRMRKVVCEGEGHEKPYILRGAKATLELGVPACPVCGVEMRVEEPEDGEEDEGE